METKRKSFLARATMTLSGARCAAVMLLVMMLTMTAQTAWADTWPAYITDIILVGGSSDEVKTAKSANSGYSWCSMDLNDGAAGDYINLGYKTGYRANVNGGYITDIIVIDAEGTNPPSTVTYSGRTYCSKLKIGGTLIVDDNFLSENKRSNVPQDNILITELVHYFSLDNTYNNHFVGIPTACDYPPYYNSDVYPVAPSCRARVKDNEDPNGLGRIRVQFDWQIQLSEETGEDMMTPWLRMAQPYAGGGKGFSFIPEIDEEVMIDFEGGNAERPYVKGTLYNGVGNVDGAWVANSNSANQIKAIRTRNGHTIEIHDEGNDGYIRIYDNEKENYILTFSTDQKLIKLESTGNIELYAKNDIIMHAGHDINASADNDIFIAASHDMQRTADNDIREHAGNDRSTNIDRNDSLSVSENQFIRIGDNKDEQVEHKLQITAENIREEAKDKLLEYSTTHHMKAGDQMALNSGSQIDIKSGIVKVQ